MRTLVILSYFYYEMLCGKIKVGKMAKSVGQ